MTGSEYHSEDIKRREAERESKKHQHVKHEKLLTLSNKISEHDLNSKIDKCVKWIQKLHEIRVVISGSTSDVQKSEQIASMIEEQVKKVEGRVLQKRNKDGVLKFSIMPTIKKEKDGIAADPLVIHDDKKLLDNHPPPFVQQVRTFHSKGF